MEPLDLENFIEDRSHSKEVSRSSMSSTRILPSSNVKRGRSCLSESVSCIPSLDEDEDSLKKKKMKITAIYYKQAQIQKLEDISNDESRRIRNERNNNFMCDFDEMLRLKNINKKTKNTADTKLKLDDPSLVTRARVPLPSNKDYVVRPKSAVEFRVTETTKRKPNRLERCLKKFRSLKRSEAARGSIRAVKVSIDGRNIF